VVSRSRVVGVALVRMTLFGTVIVRAMFVRTVFFGATLVGAPVPARLRNLRPASRPVLTSRIVFTDTRGISRVLVQRDKSACRQYCA